MEVFYGWVPQWDEIHAGNAISGHVGSVNPRLLSTKKVNTYLWLALLATNSSWKRGSQGIGDCVGWGAELAATTLMGLQHVQGISRFEGEASTEASYGGARVEARGRQSGGWSDGAYGFAAAKFYRDWGVILRKDYSKETGNPEHDMRRYGKTKAKDWGNYGCGGQRDKGKLDSIAKRMPINQVVGVKDPAEAESLILNGYPITIASAVGFKGMRRNSLGVVRRSGRWNHQMVVLGVRYLNGTLYFRVFNSWGKCASGADPGVEHEAIKDTSWWITEQDMAYILKSGDCWGFSDVEGLPKREIDLIKVASNWKGTTDGTIDITA